MQSKINFKALFLGTLVDIVGSLALGVVIGIVAGIMYAKTGKNIDGFEQYYYSNITLMVISLLLGLLFVTLGGFVAGKIAKANEILNACGVGVVGILFGLLFCWSLPIWYNIASFLLIMPFAYYGGKIAIRVNNR